MAGTRRITRAVNLTAMSKPAKHRNQQNSREGAQDLEVCLTASSPSAQIGQVHQNIPPELDGQIARIPPNAGPDYAEGGRDAKARNTTRHEPND